jgi:hypothetical protein
MYDIQLNRITFFKIWCRIFFLRKNKIIKNTYKFFKYKILTQVLITYTLLKVKYNKLFSPCVLSSSGITSRNTFFRVNKCMYNILISLSCYTNLLLYNERNRFGTRHYATYRSLSEVSVSPPSSSISPGGFRQRSLLQDSTALIAGLYTQPDGCFFLQRMFTAYFALLQILKWKPTCFYTTNENT